VMAGDESSLIVASEVAELVRLKWKENRVSKRGFKFPAKG
jgi:hypothetical protein